MRRLADKYGACDYAGAIEPDAPFFHCVLHDMEYHLGQAVIPANAYLVGQLLADSPRKCVCGSSGWNRWREMGARGDELACAQCEDCGLQMTFRVLPQPKQERGCTCELCGDGDIPF